MKICHILTSNPSDAGGVETVVTNIKENHDVKYLGTTGPFVFLKGFFLALRLAFSKYDLVVSHDNAAYMYARLPKFMRRPKLLACYYGVTEYYYEVLPPKTFLQKIQARVYTHLQAYTIKRADKVITFSDWTSEKFKKLYNVNTTVVPLGIDTKKFRPMDTKKKYDFIWIGTNPKLKGLAIAIDYSRKQHKQLLAVGVDGKSDETVTYAGKVSYASMPKIINTAKAILYFSEYKGCPLAVFEAMACELDVVSNKRLDEMNFSRKGEMFFMSGKEARKIAVARDWHATIKEYNKVYSGMLQ